MKRYAIRFAALFVAMISSIAVFRMVFMTPYPEKGDGGSPNMKKVEESYIDDKRRDMPEPEKTMQTQPIPSESTETPSPEKTGDVAIVEPLTPRAPITFAGAKNRQLLKLSEYQTVTGGFVADKLMVFVNMPQTAASIRSSAQYITRTSGEFKKYGIEPVFVFEPSDENGMLLNLKKVAEGKYRKNLEKLFSEIKIAGAIENNLGIFVPYPEANTPSWDRKSFSPGDFPGMVNDFFSAAKKYFPNIKGSLLLDYKTYGVEEKSWDNGKSTSLSPYITGIQKTHIQSFGLQGFPWIGKDTNEKHYDATIFLPIDTADEAARILGTDTIWFNTGTFREKYSIGKVSTGAEERMTMLKNILHQAEILKSRGFKPWINIFAQDKMRTQERTDWSYLDKNKSAALSSHEDALKKFVDEATSDGITLSLFDQ